MFDYIFWLLAKVRDDILDGLVIPGLDMSYWDFCIYLAIATVVAVVLLNGVRISGGASASDRRYKAFVKQREREKASSKSKTKE